MKFYPDESIKVDHLQHYSLRKVFSFNVKYMYLIGGRRYGKTYGIKTFLFKDFIKNGHKFAWIRTTDRALEKIKKPTQFFGRMKNLKELGIENYDIKKDIIYINGKEAGHLFSVSTFFNDKGADYDCVNGVYDEFMRAKGERPVSDKRRKFFDLVESVFRGDGQRIFLLSNSINQYDEMLEPFNLTLKEYGCYLYLEKNAVIHYIKTSKTHILNMENSLSGFGMTAEDKKMAFSNQFTSFGDFGKVTKGVYMFTLQVDDDKFINLYNCDGSIYCRQRAPSPQDRIFSFTPDYVSSKVKRLSQSGRKLLQQTFDNGRCVFETGYVRTMITELLN